MKRLASVEVLHEDIEGPAAKLPFIETWEEAHPTRIYPEPYNASSKSLTFEIKPRKENWFIPSDVELHLKVRPLQNNDQRPTDPVAAANGVGVHIRFINDLASWLIKSIRVNPKRQHDVEVPSPYISFEESLRSDLQTSREEKEKPELLFSRGYDPKINYNSHKNKCGFAKPAPDAEETVIKTLKYNRSSPCDHSRKRPALVTTTVAKSRLNCHSNSVINNFWELPTGLFLCF